MAGAWTIVPCVVVFFDEVVFLVYFMQRPLGAWGTHFFLPKIRRYMELALFRKKENRK